MTNHGQLTDLVPLYALDALDGEELTVLERHLRSCELCQDELDGFRSVTSALVPDEPAPDHVWDRVATEIRTAATSGPSTVLSLHAIRDRRTRGFAWVASIAAVAALVFGAVNLFQPSRVSGLSGEDGIVTAAEEAAQAPGAIVGDFLVDDTSVAKVVLSEDGRGYVIPTEELDPLNDARTYQLWVINTKEEAISAGVLGNDPGAVTFTWTGDVAGFALTRELAGGVISSEGDVVSVIADL